VVAEPEDDLPEIDWKLPSIALLDTVTARRERMADEIKRNVKILETTLATFGVECKVIGVNPGPAVTQYEIQPGPGVQVKRITALSNDLSLALAAAPLRIEAPIPGKSAVGIEVPNKSASLVTIREVLETAVFREGTHALALGLGNDVSGASIVSDLTPDAAPSHRRGDGPGQERLYQRPDHKPAVPGHARAHAAPSHRPEARRADRIQRAAAPGAAGARRVAPGRRGTSLGGRRDGSPLQDVFRRGRAQHRRLQREGDPAPGAAAALYRHRHRRAGRSDDGRGR